MDKPFTYEPAHLPPEGLIDLFDRPETPLPEDGVVERRTVAIILAELMDIICCWCQRDNAYDASWVSVKKPRHTPSVIIDHRTHGMIIIGPHTPQRDFADGLVVFDAQRYLLWDPACSPLHTLVNLINEVNGRTKFAHAWQDGARLPLGRHGEGRPVFRQALERARTRSVQLWTDLQAPPSPINALFRICTPHGPRNDN